MPLYNTIMCRYNEIATKGHNRGMFERLFLTGIKRTIQDIMEPLFLRERGRILLHQSRFQPFTTEQLAGIYSRMPLVFGLSSYSPGIKVATDFSTIVAAIKSHFPEIYQLSAGQIGDDTPITYRMRARRGWKPFPMTSQEIEIHFSDLFLRGYPRLQLNLKEAKIDIGLEIREHWSFIYFNEFPGPGGLPSGTNGSALSLLSGGIDSPVASYLAMKRGTRLHFLTFHSYPYTPAETLDKVGQLVKVLNRYQTAGILYACNISAAQKIIRDICLDKYRTILYRRLMIRIAAHVARVLKLTALVTGDVVGQVASQTLKNMDAINRATDYLILRPLISMDKYETVSIGRRIGTLEISEQYSPDCCVVFEPRSPATGALLGRVLDEESKLDIPELMKCSLTTLTPTITN